MSLKRKKKTVLEKQTREFVILLRDYFEREQQNGGPLLPLNRVVDRVSEALGIGRNTVTRITREKFGRSGMEDNELVTPNKIRPKRRSRKTCLSSKSDVSDDPQYIEVPNVCSPTISDSECTKASAVSGMESKHPSNYPIRVTSGKSTWPITDLETIQQQFKEELEDNIVIIVHPMFDDQPQFKKGRNSQ